MNIYLLNKVHTGEVLLIKASSGADARETAYRYDKSWADEAAATCKIIHNRGAKGVVLHAQKLAKVYVPEASTPSGFHVARCGQPEAQQPYELTVEHIAKAAELEGRAREQSARAARMTTAELERACFATGAVRRRTGQ